MTNANLGRMLRALDTELKGALEKSRASFEHRGLQGTGPESAVRSLLDLHLPRYLTVGTGEVIDQTDTRSGQIDVVIANEDQPFRNDLHEPGVFLIEGVSAAGEIKSRLTTQKLGEAIESATRFKRLRSNDVNAFHAALESDQRRFHQSRPYFLFAFENAVSTDTLLQRVASASRVQAPDGSGAPLSPLDAVFILGQGVAIDFGDGNGSLQGKYTTGLMAGQKITNWWWDSQGDSVIILLLLWLSSVMPRFVKMSSIATEYLSRLINPTEP